MHTIFIFSNSDLHLATRSTRTKTMTMTSSTAMPPLTSSRGTTQSTHSSTTHSRPQLTGLHLNTPWQTSMCVESRELTEMDEWLVVKMVHLVSGAGTWPWSTPWINTSVVVHSLEHSGFSLLLIVSQSEYFSKVYCCFLFALNYPTTVE